MNDSFKGRKSRGKKKSLKLIVAIEISQHYQLFLLATTYFLAYRDIWFPQLLTFLKKSLREQCPSTELFLVRIFLYRIYSVNLHIQSEYRKIRTRNNSVFGQFSRSECSYFLFFPVKYHYGPFCTFCLPLLFTVG